MVSGKNCWPDPFTWLWSALHARQDRLSGLFFACHLPGEWQNRTDLLALVSSCASFYFL